NGRFQAIERQSRSEVFDFQHGDSKRVSQVFRALAAKPYPLNQIARDASLVPLVEVRRPHVRMPEERLNLISRNALLVQVGGNRDGKGVGRNGAADGGPLGVPPHHLVNIIASHLRFRELARPSCSRAKEIERLPFPRLLVSRPTFFLDAAPLKILVKENLQVMGDGNLSRLAPLLIEVEHPLVGSLVVVVTLEGCDRSNSSTRIGLPIATEKKPTNLVSGPSSNAISLLKTRLRGAKSRNLIRECLSRIEIPQISRTRRKCLA